VQDLLQSRKIAEKIAEKNCIEENSIEGNSIEENNRTSESFFIQ
jgi:hypothetical protein